ncbi:MAG TPA: hypothetical protein PKH77_12055 [Anaerolineae bacterium]|nr:hypothetical protein [Anaerolineae bacterium]
MGSSRQQKIELIRSFIRLAVEMEKDPLDTPLIHSNQVSHDKEETLWNLRTWNYQARAGKMICEAYQAGEFRQEGLLCKGLDDWCRLPYPQNPDWCYAKGFETICSTWPKREHPYAFDFEYQKRTEGELRTYAKVLRLLVGLLEEID